MRSLESYRGKDFVGVEELTTVAASLVERYREEPDRGNVRLTITQRIVRHYLAEDLLGDPSGQSGTSTVFNYANLLRLLAVKKLLADNWSVVKIREFMSALDITALEQLINSAFDKSPRSHIQNRRETESAQSQAQNFRSVHRSSQENRQHGSPLFAAPPVARTQPPPLASLVMASAKRAERKGEEWIELMTGLEIKVRRSFRPPRTEHERNRLAARFWAVVGKKKIE
jgi:DNA-binding transcriptional MerR regulator